MPRHRESEVCREIHHRREVAGCSQYRHSTRRSVPRTTIPASHTSSVARSLTGGRHKRFRRHFGRPNHYINPSQKYEPRSCRARGGGPCRRAAPPLCSPRALLRSRCNPMRRRAGRTTSPYTNHVLTAITGKPPPQHYRHHIHSTNPSLPISSLMVVTEGCSRVGRMSATTLRRGRALWRCRPIKG